MKLAFWRRDKEQEPPKKIEVVFAHATELDPAKRYMIVMDAAAVSKADAHVLLDNLHAMGINHAVGLMTDGDPSTAVQVIEQV